MRWFWAAYQMGSWRDLIDSGLPQPVFAEEMYEIIGHAGYDWILEARGADGNRPCGLILANAVGRGIEPFVHWFPWATTRNQMEATAAFLREISPRFKIFVFAEEKSTAFWTKFTHHRMIRRGCKVLDYFSRGEHAMMFYTTGP